MWILLRSLGSGLILIPLILLCSLNAEAGVFWWFNKIEVQVSPEIKGAVMLHDKPQANMRIKRGTFFEDGWSWDSTQTDADGHFYFAEKLIQAREVLHERQVAVQLLAVDYPNKGDEDLFFRIGESHDLKSPSRDLLTDGMVCELSANYEMSYLKFIEHPDAPWRGFESKCRFLHADKVIVSAAELQAVKLERSWDDVYSLLSYIEQNVKDLNTDNFVRVHVRSSAESGLNILQRIAELEPSAEKRNTLPQLERQFKSYLALLDKEEQQ